MTGTQIWGVILAFISASTYAFLPIFTMGAYATGMAIDTLLFMRFFIAASFLWLIIIYKKIAWRLSAEQVKLLIPMILVGFCINTKSFFYSYKLIAPTLSTILFFIYPFFILIYETVVQKKVLRLYKFIAVLLAFLGLFLIVWQKGVVLNPVGVFFSLLAGASYALFCGLIAHPKLQNLSAYTLSAWVMSAASVVFLISCLIFNEPIISYSFNGWLYVSLNAFFCTIVATLSIYSAIKFIGVFHASVIATSEPVIVFLMSWLFLNQKLTLNIAFGLFFMVIGLLTLQWPSIVEVIKKRNAQTE